MKALTSVCSSSNRELPPPCISSFGLKSVLFCVAKSLPIQVRVTSSVRCMRTLTLSSMWFNAIVVVFSISLRIVTFAAASGMRTVLMQVSIRCMIVMADCRFSRYERSGSFFVFSWAVAASLALWSIDQQSYYKIFQGTHASKAVSM